MRAARVMGNPLAGKPFVSAQMQSCFCAKLCRSKKRVLHHEGSCVNATSVCLLFLALLCALAGSFFLMIVRTHLRDPDFLQTQWAKHERVSLARGITPARTPAWEQQLLRQEKTRQLSAWALLLLSAIIIVITIVSGGG
jgi:hypothetical protein